MILFFFFVFEHAPCKEAQESFQVSNRPITKDLKIDGEYMEQIDIEIIEICEIRVHVTAIADKTRDGGSRVALVRYLSAPLSPPGRSVR